MTSGIRHPKVTVPLSGQDGNIYAITARVSRALRSAGVPRQEIAVFEQEIQNAQSYDEALQTVMRWVKTS